MPVTQGQGIIAERHRKARVLLAEFATKHGVEVEFMQRKSQELRVVGLRRAFARLCKSRGIGQVVIASALQMHPSSVAYYLSDEMRGKILARNRRRRDVQRNNVANG